MTIQPGNVQGYNNEIQIAGSDAAIGHNPGINKADQINPASKGDKTFQGKTISPAGTVHKGPQPAGGARTPRRMTTARLLHLRLTLQVFRRNGRAMGRRWPTKKKNGPCGCWNSSWPSGGLVFVSLASPEQPRETGFPQQWPRPTNFLLAKSRFFPTCPGAKRQLSQ